MFLHTATSRDSYLAVLPLSCIHSPFQLIYQNHWMVLVFFVIKKVPRFMLGDQKQRDNFRFRKLESCGKPILDQLECLSFFWAALSLSYVSSWMAGDVCTFVGAMSCAFWTGGMALHRCRIRYIRKVCMPRSYFLAQLTSFQ